MNKKQKRLSDYEISSGTLGVTEMFGAILFMLLGGLKKDFSYYHQVEYQKRNIKIGYITSIILFIAIISITFFFLAT